MASAANAETIAARITRIMAGLPPKRYTSRFVCSKTGAELWNPTVASVARWCECDEDDVDFFEDDDGTEYVLAQGERVGIKETM